MSGRDYILDTGDPVRKRQSEGLEGKLPASAKQAGGATGVTALLRKFQQTAGNQAVNQLLRQYAAGQAQSLQREEDDNPLMTKREVGIEGGPVSQATTQRIESARGSGASLDTGARAQMESVFGASFEDVRVHSDSESDVLNRKVSATAFTTGSDIFFRQGAYQPGSSEGTNLLAHELTHVVQQRGMSGSGPLTVGPAGDSYEQEADAASSAVASTAQSGVPVAQRDLEEGAAANMISREDLPLDEDELKST